MFSAGPQFEYEVGKITFEGGKIKIAQGNIGGKIVFGEGTALYAGLEGEAKDQISLILD